MARKQVGKPESTESKVVNTIKMYNPDTKVMADVHPLEQLNYFKCGYRKLKEG